MAVPVKNDFTHLEHVRAADNGGVPLIQLRNVGKTYRTAAGDFNALKSINLDIQAGEFLGILGKSGAGKSTLLNMITGVDQLTTGEVQVDGVIAQPAQRRPARRLAGSKPGHRLPVLSAAAHADTDR